MVTGFISKDLKLIERRGLYYCAIATIPPNLDASSVLTYLNFSLCVLSAYSANSAVRSFINY